jgi:tripeptide aminopeptidase
MFDKYEFTVVERFMRYVQMDTQSDPQSHTHPTSMKQKGLSVLLAQELKTIGIEDVYTDKYGYVYATIPSNTEKKVPVVCFCAHIDTAPDCSGTNVVPILHESYDGSDIVLPDDVSQILSLKDNPFLKEQIGYSLITASGTTLLGADDKSGLAIIMDFANYICTYPNVRHGIIKLLFTPDEEVGQGTAKLDLVRLGADFAYTLDGGEAGTLEDETFSADSVEITINGVISHPGTAKGKLINAIKIAGEILMALPTNELSPETTEKREGFVHPVAVNGIAEKATIEFIIRDFITANLQKYEERLKDITTTVVSKYPKASFEFAVREQYRNMKEILDQHPKIVDYAMEAYRRAGLKVVNEPIRGGTDGSRLSFMGLPCPNLFTGMQAIHSKKEWIGVKDMKKAVEVLVNLVQVWEESI